jgi:hypothetical protein
MAPPQAFGQENLVDAAALDADSLLLVEVGLQAVRRPATEGQTQALRIGQRGGDDLGASLSGIGRRPPVPRVILQSVESLIVEAVDPGVGRRPRDAQVLGDLARAVPISDGPEDLSPLDEAGLGRA